MRKLVFLAASVLVLLASPALAHGPSGSHEEDSRRPRWDNNVRCRGGTSTPAAVIYASRKGAEVCNDGRGAVPIQGRLIVARAQGGYVAADGDRNNPGQLKGWARIDRKGLRCGDSRGRLDATHPTRKDTARDCG